MISALASICWTRDLTDGARGWVSFENWFQADSSSFRVSTVGSYTLFSGVMSPAAVSWTGGYVMRRQLEYGSAASFMFEGNV